MFTRFRKSLLALALAVFPMAAHALGPLVDVADLRSAIQTEAPVVLDIRAEDAYQKGHVPGALNAPYALFRGPAENPGELVSETHLTEVLRGLGIAPDTPVVVVHQGTNQTDFGAAARVYYPLNGSKPPASSRSASANE
jgi:thiosulfate/3-mercaptopyruvate sulfurtransferase